MTTTQTYRAALGATLKPIIEQAIYLLRLEVRTSIQEATFNGYCDHLRSTKARLGSKDFDYLIAEIGKTVDVTSLFAS